MLGRQKVCAHYAEVTPRMGMHLISIHILEPFRQLLLLRRWDKGMDITPEDDSSYTTQYQHTVLTNVEDEYSAKLRDVPLNTLECIFSSNLIPSARAEGFCE